MIFCELLERGGWSAKQTTAGTCRRIKKGVINDAAYFTDTRAEPERRRGYPPVAVAGVEPVMKIGWLFPVAIFGV